MQLNLNSNKVMNNLRIFNAIEVEESNNNKFKNLNKLLVVLCKI